jgi:uncharacterized membrane protein
MPTRRSEPTRLEAFSDAVFAFALTLLVVSLEVPRSYEQLTAALHNFLAFAITFVMLVWIWYKHNVFFRRYALSDGPMIALNAALLFVVLLYVYPLKFLSQVVIDQLIGTGPTTPVVPTDQSANLVMIYGAGYVAVFLAFFLMYLYAYSRRRVLALTPDEVRDTRYELEVEGINIGVGLFSIAVAATGGPSAAGIAGLVYFALGPLRAAHGAWSARRSAARRSRCGDATRRRRGRRGRPPTRRRFARRPR